MHRTSGEPAPPERLSKERLPNGHRCRSGGSRREFPPLCDVAQGGQGGREEETKGGAGTRPGTHLEERISSNSSKLARGVSPRRGHSGAGECPRESRLPLAPRAPNMGGERRLA